MELPVFKVIEGKNDVLISAPHAFAHNRPTLKSTFKLGEEFTSEIVKEVCVRTGAWGICLDKTSEHFDPNFHKLIRNPYKEKILELLKEKKITKVIDVHGLSDYHNFDLGIYYCMRFSKSKSMAMQMIKCLAKQPELKGMSYHIWYDKKNSQETITEFVCDINKFPAIQVEISREIRKDPILRNSVVEGVSEFVMSL